MTHIERLARYVHERRKELGDSQTEFADRGSMSMKTIQRIERATVDSVSLTTLAGLDRAAGWEPGSARNVYEHGGEPSLPAPQRVDGAEVERAALQLWAAMNKADDDGSQDALVAVHEELAQRLDIDTLRAVTDRVAELTKREA